MDKWSEAVVGKFSYGILLGLFFAFVGQVFAADTVRVAAIRVEFVADDAATTTGNGKFDLSQPQSEMQIDPPPHNRLYFQDHLTFLKNYFYKVSHGQLIIEGAVFPEEVDAAYQLPQPMTYYNPNREPALNNQRYAELLRDAVLLADADPAVNLSRFDVVMVFHAGVGKDVDLGFDETPQDIPSFYLNQQFLQEHLGVEAIELSDGTRITGGILLPETESQAGIELGLNGMVVANFASYLGMLDLFDPVNRTTGVGRMGLMDAGLFNGDGLLPALPMAWQRMQLGWEVPQTILSAQDDELTIHHVLSDQMPRVYRFPINEQEYFLVENRYNGGISLDSLKYEMAAAAGRTVNMKEVLLTHLPDAVTFSERGVLIDVDNPDRGLPGSGVLIWHVDEQVIAAKRADNAINSDMNHRGIDVEEADGSQDIGQVFDFFSAGAGSELGTPLDFWYEGNTAPLFKNEFSPTSVPNSRSYRDYANSHITLKQFSRPGASMTFQARLDIFQPGFPLTLTAQPGETVQSLRLADITRDGREEMVMVTTRGAVRIIDGTGRYLWQSGDAPVVQLPGDLVVPLPLFQLDNGVAMAAVQSSGQGQIIQFNPLTQQAQIVFTFSVTDEVTTEVLARYNWQQSSPFPEGIVTGREISLYFGGKSGAVYRVRQENDQWTVTTLFQLPAPVKFVHVGLPDEVWAMDTTGAVFRNGEAMGQLPELPIGRPAGISPRVILPGGLASLENLDEPQYLPKPMNLLGGLSMPLNPLMEETPVAVARDFVLVFQRNAVVAPDYPFQVTRPARNARFAFQPLVLPGEGENERTIVVVDSAGTVYGVRFDTPGLQEAFPLNAGEPLAVPPAAGDLDGDGDVELVGLTRGNTLYVWDLPYPLQAEKAWQYWLQTGGGMENNNHFPIAGTMQPVAPQAPGEGLLPEKTVFCWPNPVSGDMVAIRYWLGEEAEVSVEIYDLAGTKIASLPAPNAVRQFNETRWRTSAVASGVYVARVEARSASGSEVRFVKIAVVK